MEADDIRKRVGKSIKLGLDLGRCAKRDNLTANSNYFCTFPVPSEAFRQKAIQISLMNPGYYTWLTSQHPFPTVFLFVQQNISYMFQEKKIFINGIIPYGTASTKAQGMQN